MKNSRNADSTVAIEEYMPDLSEKYQTRFTALVEKLESTMPHNRNYLLEKVDVSFCEQEVAGTDGGKIKAKIELQIMKRLRISLLSAMNKRHQQL